MALALFWPAKKRVYRCVLGKKGFKSNWNVFAFPTRYGFIPDECLVFLWFV